MFSGLLLLFSYFFYQHLILHESKFQNERIKWTTKKLQQQIDLCYLALKKGRISRRSHYLRNLTLNICKVD